MMPAPVRGEAPPTECLECGASITQPERLGRPRRFCSSECTKAAWTATRCERLLGTHSGGPAAYSDALDGVLELRAARRRCEESMRSLRIGLGLEAETVDRDPDPTPDGWTGYVSPQGWA